MIFMGKSMEFPPRRFSLKKSRPPISVRALANNLEGFDLAADRLMVHQLMYIYIYIYIHNIHICIHGYYTYTYMYIYMYICIYALELWMNE